MTRHTPSHLPKKQAGLTLVEVVAAITIGALLTVGAVAMFGPGASGGKSQQVLSDLVSFRTLIPSVVPSNSTPDSTTATGGVLAGLQNAVPATWTGYTAGTWTTPLGTGTIKLASMSAGPNQYTITYNTMDSGTCQKVLMGLPTGVGYATATGVATATVGAAFTLANVIAGPVPAATATTACAQSATNGVAFMFIS